MTTMVFRPARTNFDGTLIAAAAAIRTFQGGTSTSMAPV